MDRYFLASELAFYAPDPDAAVSDVTAAHLFGRVGLMYERWTSPAAARGRPLLLVSWDANDLDAPEVRAGVEQLGPLQEGELRRNERFVRYVTIPQPLLIVQFSLRNEERTRRDGGEKHVVCLRWKEP